MCPKSCVLLNKRAILNSTLLKVISTDRLRYSQLGDKMLAGP